MATYSRSTGVQGLLIFGFIDCTVRAVRRPLYGHEAIYSGHKKVHGLKYQAIGLPDGLLAVLSEPRAGRRHDRRVLVESQLEGEIRVLQTQTGLELLEYGDPAYGNTDTIMAGFNRLQRSENQDMEWLTKAMNADRTSVEWLFGIVCNKFKWLDYKDGNRIGTTAVGCYYTVAVLLTNCITCLRGGTQHYARFYCPPPTLHEYLAM